MPVKPNQPLSAIRVCQPGGEKPASNRVTTASIKHNRLIAERPSMKPIKDDDEVAEEEEEDDDSAIDEQEEEASLGDVEMIDRQSQPSVNVVVTKADGEQEELVGLPWAPHSSNYKKSIMPQIISNSTR